MATVSKGRTIVSGETVTPAKLNDLVDNATVSGIVNADISASAGIVSSKLSTAAQQALVPPGAILVFAMSSPPNGWLAADGAAVSRTTYAALFSVLGTYYGSGDGSTTFNVPDLQGVFVRGSGSQTISGTTYSATFGSKQQDALKSHTHTVSDTDSAVIFNLRQDGANTANVVSGTITRTTSATGDTETRPANIALLYCIKF